MAKWSFVLCRMKGASCRFWRRFCFYWRIILSKRRLMSFSSGCHRFFWAKCEACTHRNEWIGFHMYRAISSVSIFDHGSLDSSLHNISSSRPSNFLNIKHLSDLIRGLSKFQQWWLRLLFSEYFNTAFFIFLLISFVFKERYASRRFAVVIVGGWANKFRLIIKSLLLQLIHHKLCFFSRINKFMKDSFLFRGLLLSDITFCDKIVILGLVLEEIEIQFFISFFVMFFEEIHIFFEILFVFLKVIQCFLFVLIRVKDFVLHFFLLFVGAKRVGGL